MLISLDPGDLDDYNQLVLAEWSLCDISYTEQSSSGSYQRKTFTLALPQAWLLTGV